MRHVAFKPTITVESITTRLMGNTLYDNPVNSYIGRPGLMCDVECRITGKFYKWRPLSNKFPADGRRWLGIEE